MISVSYYPVSHSPNPDSPAMSISRSYPEGSRSCKFYPCHDALLSSDVLGLQLNLEVPAYEFNEAEGKLVIG